MGSADVATTSPPLFEKTEVEVPEFVLSKESTEFQDVKLEEPASSSHFADVAEEEDPVDAVVEKGLSQLGFTADGVTQVYLDLNLKGKNLDNVDFLCSYDHIQVLDVSENNLTDLTPLKHLPYLISLNASHNKLRTIIDTKPPIGLREVNFSYNDLEEICDLSCHSLLCTLLIDNNVIEEIKGIDQCYALRNISLSHNKLTKISGLDGLPILQLDLSYNYIRKIENLHTLKNLQYINLGYNSIRSLRGLQDHELLEDINLRYNQIIDMSEIRYLRGLRLLRILNLDGNPIQEVNDYRLSVLFRIPALMELDVAPVSCEEKVAAVNLFKPSIKLVTSADHMENLMKSYLKPTVLLPSTLPSNAPYPMLVFVGPLGMGKKVLAQRIAGEFAHAFGVCIGHTTRPECTYLRDGKTLHEEDGVTYHYVIQEDFETLKEKGEFLQTCTLYGHDYGMSFDAIESIAAKSLACILTMELEGIMGLKKTHFKPRCILIVPQDINRYKDRLLSTNGYSESEINESIQRINTYIDVHQTHPGYFDAAIMSDDVEETYARLKIIVDTYLAITPPSTARTSSSSSDGRCPAAQEVTSTVLHPTISSLIDKRGSLTNVMAHSVSDSYQRRYKRTKAALMGVTSSFQEQMDKIKSPLTSAPVPFVKGYEDLIKNGTFYDSPRQFDSSDDDDEDVGQVSTGETDLDARLTSELTTDSVLRYQDLDNIDLE